MKKYFNLGLSLMLLGSISAQNKFEQDRSAIKQMAGCYKVTFNFAETFSTDTAYTRPEGHTSSAYEYVKLIEDEPTHLALQHLLIADEGKGEMVIKHWRQDWDYENTDFYMYNNYNPQTHGQEWNYTHKSPEEVKGQWTQKVYQVDDSPRYEGSATWVHYDGRHYWENTTDAPLPRREYTTRRDYNVLQRTNKQEITDFGWIHDQDNAKILRTQDGDKIIAYEKGWNTYEKVSDNKCEAAAKWWSENKDIWKNVRAAWKNRFEEKRNLTVWSRKGKNIMYKSFFDLKDDTTIEDAEKVIKEFSN